jgi:sugar/nucleoside kinase (ribokinase family)
VAALAVVGNISRDLTCHPDGRRHLLLGGAALHIARAAARAGLDVASISVIGSDLAWIRDDPRLSTLDLTPVMVTGRSSCAFTLTYDEGGHLVAADCAYGVATALTEHALTQLDKHRAFHVCCRQPLDASRVISVLTAAGREFSVDFFSTSAEQMISAVGPYLPMARLIFTNTAEYRMLAAAVNPTRLRAVVVTDGESPASLMRHGRVVAAATPPPTTVVEVTGAGDAVTGTFLAATNVGATDDEALTAAVLAATRAVASPGIPFPSPPPGE